jgi:dihydroorotate dehydrogenase
LFDALYNHGHFVVNVSSSNTPNFLLQGQRATHTIVATLQNKNWLSQNKPFTKNCSDLTDEQLVDIIDIIADTKIGGVIATNTTISREGIQSQ